MQCRGCGYALWNLSEPRCPECGEGFDLRTFRFVPGTVAFACPHCQALHGGAGLNHIPSTADTAVCRSCHFEMDVPAMRVVPQTDPPVPAVGTALPWEDRERLGVWRAWWATLGAGMVLPMRLGARLSPQGGFGESYIFALGCYLLAGLAQIAMILLCCGGIGLIDFYASGPGGGGVFFDSEMLVMMGVCFGVTLASALVAPLLAAVFVAGPAHLALMLIEPGRANFTTTARVVNYAQAPMVLLAVPLVGYHFSFFWWIWMLTSATLGFQQAHRISGGKAALAMLWFPALLLVLGAGLLTVLIVMDL